MHPSHVGRKVQGLELTHDEYERLQVNAGVALRTGLEAALTADGWVSLPELARREIVETIIAKSRAQARKLTAMEPDFFKRRMEAMRKDLEDKLGKASEQ